MKALLLTASLALGLTGFVSIQSVRAAQESGTPGEWQCSFIINTPPGFGGPGGIGNGCKVPVVATTPDLQPGDCDWLSATRPVGWNPAEVTPRACLIAPSE
jgi:hypothetical protein